MANLNPVPACTNSNYGDVVDFFVGSVATNVININLTSDEVVNQSDDAVAFRNGTGAFVTTAAIADYRSGETDFTTGSAGFSTAATSAEAGLLQRGNRSEEHTSELQSLMRISYAVFCLKKKKNTRDNI